MNDNLKLNIADIFFLFITKERALIFKHNLPYRHFLTDGKADSRPEVILRFQYGLYSHQNKNKRILFDAQPNWRLYYSNKKYILEGRDRTMVLTSDFTSGEIYIVKNRDDFPFAYPLDEILMINLLGRKRGILMHACGVRNRNGRVILFAGSSDAGKSTMANLWKSKRAVTVLNDDRIIVRKKKACFWAYGTPWYGDVKVCSPEKAPLEKVFFLKHSKNNTIRKTIPIEATSRLITCCFPTFWDKKGMEFTLSFCAELAQNVPCYELGFIPDKSIIEFLKGVF